MPLNISDKDAKSSVIVDSVGRLVQQHNTTTVQQLKNLLQTEDLDGFVLLVLACFFFYLKKNSPAIGSMWR